METTAFSFAEFNKLRQAAAREIGAAGGIDRPPHGWSIHPADPARLLQGHACLKLKDGIALRAYRYHWGNGGHGKVWALPQGAAFPDPAKPEAQPKAAPGFWTRLTYLWYDLPASEPHAQNAPPKPPGALSDFVAALEGDGTPWSYLCAAVLVRDLRAFGEFWHNQNWSAHSLLEAVPQRNPWKPEPPPAPGAGMAPPMAAWTTSAPEPAEWRPNVAVDGKTVTVTFYTYCGRMREGIYRHVDQFKSGSYAFTSKDEKIAEGMGGYHS